MRHWTTFKTFLVGLPKTIGELPKKNVTRIFDKAERLAIPGLAHMGRPG